MRVGARPVRARRPVRSATVSASAPKGHTPRSIRCLTGVAHGFGLRRAGQATSQTQGRVSGRLREVAPAGEGEGRAGGRHPVELHAAGNAGDRRRGAVSRRNPFQPGSRDHPLRSLDAMAGDLHGRPQAPRGSGSVVLRRFDRALGRRHAGRRDSEVSKRIWASPWRQRGSRAGPQCKVARPGAHSARSEEP